MRQRLLVLAIAFGSAVAAAHTWAADRAPYTPAVPAASVNNYGGGWGGGYSGASTAAGSALNGMSSVISAAGDYNLSTSAAAINMTEAQRNDIQNHQLYTDTYFQMRATNKAAREAERGPRATMEQITRIAKEGVPQMLSTSEMDPVTGKLDWPGPLTTGMYTSSRTQMDQLFVKRAKQGGLAYPDQTKVRTTCDAMANVLKTQIREMPPPEYTAAKNFLQAVIYTATKTELQ